ncbi:nuclear transcription factor Y subunit alpha isoform X1 [Pelobates cultripes]|uniref:Nuclear transcription factor Y subunit alpha isoform X1 n=1 Tax=Pelobates cultripes TaxID=61616 RepID=A0AAD1VMR9_PELCU|nr:nuclear transcription factor Y subunit alpha isoform X1 [Pelobates cultripes]
MLGKFNNSTQPKIFTNIRPQFFHQFPPTQKTRYPMVNTAVTPTGVAPLSILASTDHPNTKQYFQYAQLAHFLKGDPHLLRGTRAYTKYETYCTTHSLQTKHLSIFYTLLDTASHTLPPTFTAAWETELGITIPVGTCAQIFRACAEHPPDAVGTAHAPESRTQKRQTGGKPLHQADTERNKKKTDAERREEPRPGEEVQSSYLTFIVIKKDGAAGQIQQQVQGQPLMVQVSGGQLITSTGQPIMVQAMGGQGQTLMQVPVSGSQGLQQIQLVQPGQIQIQGGQALQVQTQQGQPQQIIIQQPQTAVTAGQSQGQQQIAVQGQQVAQTAEGQTIVYQPVNADGTILQQGEYTLNWAIEC